MVNYGSEYQKEGKDGEDNKVHKKNEENTEGGQSSIKKSTGEDEITSKQKEEESRSMESRR